MALSRISVIMKQKKDDDLVPTSFKNWRIKGINIGNRLCTEFEHSLIKSRSKEKESIVNLPKCMKALTTQMCRCDLKCASRSFLDVNFDSKCKLYDLKNLENEESFPNCQSLKFKVIDGKLVDKKTRVDFNNLKTKLYRELHGLCDYKQSSYAKSLCAIYEVRDYCQSIEQCYVYILNEKMPLDCINSRFREQIIKLKKILLEPLKNTKPTSLSGEIDETEDFSNADLKNLRILPNLTDDYDWKPAVMDDNDDDYLKRYTIYEEYAIFTAKLNEESNSNLSTNMPLPVPERLTQEIMSLNEISSSASIYKFNCGPAVIIMGFIMVYFGGLFSEKNSKSSRLIVQIFITVLAILGITIFY